MSTIQAASDVLGRSVRLTPVSVVRVCVQYMHTDDLSSDDEKGGNTIGRVPLHWYEEFEHIGYNAKGEKVMKSKKADGLEQAIARYRRISEPFRTHHTHDVS